MIEKYTLRSDFADEIITLNTKQDAYEHVEKQNEHIRSNYIKVLKEDNELHKAIGEYVSIEFHDLDDHWSYVKKKYKLNTTNFLFLCNC